MDSKLTLKLNKSVIERAKNYASSHKRSLSRLIEDYLNSLTNTQDNLKDTQEIQISAFVKSLSSEIKVPVDLDVKKEYSGYLNKKYS